jgi:ABC-type phosphate transport system substrate-binding protein
MIAGRFAVLALAAMALGLTASIAAGLPPPQTATPAPSPMTVVQRGQRDLSTFGACLDLRATAPTSDFQTESAYRVRPRDTLSAISARFYRAASGYQAIRAYHNAHRQLGDHPPISAQSYAIYVNGILRLPPRDTVGAAGAYQPPGQLAGTDDNFEVPGSGSVYPLMVTAANCLTHADELHIAGMPSYRGAITLVGQGTGYGRGEYCLHHSQAYTASDRAKYNEVTDCTKGGGSRPHLEIAIARDAVVVVMNRSYVESQPQLDTRHNLGYVTLGTGNVCRLLTETNDPSVHRYLSTPESGTLHFVGRRLCGNETILGQSDIEPLSERTEDYQDIAIRIAEDDRGVGYLPYAFYYQQRDRLVPVAIDGVRPILELAKPDVNPAVQCGQFEDRSAYCLSRYLWVYADRDELLRHGGLYRLLHLILGAPILIEQAHYLPLTDEMRQAELRRVAMGQ